MFFQYSSYSASWLLPLVLMTIPGWPPKQKAPTYLSAGNVWYFVSAAIWFYCWSQIGHTVNEGGYNILPMKLFCLLSILRLGLNDMCFRPRKKKEIFRGNTLALNSHNYETKINSII